MAPGKGDNMLMGYARISKAADRDTAPQRRALNEAGVSGYLKKRHLAVDRIVPNYTACLINSVKGIHLLSVNSTDYEVARLFNVHRATVSRIFAQERTSI